MRAERERIRRSEHMDLDKETAEEIVAAVKKRHQKTRRTVGDYDSALMDHSGGRELLWPGTFQSLSLS